MKSFKEYVQIVLDEAKEVQNDLPKIITKNKFFTILVASDKGPKEIDQEFETKKLAQEYYDKNLPQLKKVK